VPGQDWTSAFTDEIKSGISFLDRIEGGCGLDGGQCSRVSCSYNSAIWFCNDVSNSHPISWRKTNGFFNKKNRMTSVSNLIVPRWLHMRRLLMMSVTLPMETVKVVVLLAVRYLILIIGTILFKEIFVKLSWFLLEFYNMSRNGVGV
jgi:hypothetical protein